MSEKQNPGSSKGPVKFKPKKRPGYDPNQKNKDPNFNWRKFGRNLLLWVLFVASSILLSQLFRFDREAEQVISFSEYRDLLLNKKIERATIVEKDLHGELKAPEPRRVNGRVIKYEKFRLTLPYTTDNNMLSEWNAIGLEYDFKERSIDWVGYLLNILPWGVLIFIWIFVLRRMQSGATKGIFSFGKSKARMMSEKDTRVTFADVAGCDEAKEELREIIDFLKDPERFTKLGGKIPKGALLLGPPGTGKTLLARAVAGEAGVPFFSMSGADFVEMFVGVGASRVRDLFDQGRKNAPCIIFIDEIDAVGRHRGAGLGGGHDEREQTLNQLLVEMDGFESTEGIILIAATNRPDVLDSALLRPGRFDRQIVVDRPDVKGREGVLKVHTKKIPLDKDVDLHIVAKGTPGMAGADIANLVNEAALLAARRDAQNVNMRDFENARDKVMMGVERRSLVISDKEKRITAYHESGHVLVAKFSPDADPVHKVTIIPRGRALGVTSYLPIDDRHTYPKTYLESMIAYALGGRAAEKLIFNEMTTGAGNDIEKATDIARKMVCDWGMSEKMGPLNFGKKEEEIFLGREIAQHRDYSELTAQMIDDEVKKIVRKQEDRAEKILSENMDKLHALAEALLEREILDGEEIDAVINGKKLTPIKKEEKSVSPPVKNPAPEPVI